VPQQRSLKLQEKCAVRKSRGMGTQRTLRTKVLGSSALALVAASACLLWSSYGWESGPEAVVTRRYVAAVHQSPKAVAASPICCNPQPISLLFADRLQAAGDIVLRHRVLHWGNKHTAALVLSVLVRSAAGTAQHCVGMCQVQSYPAEWGLLSASATFKELTERVSLWSKQQHKACDPYLSGSC
jgi:hypothetical protein